MDAQYSLQWQYTDRVNQLMTAEGVKEHTVATAPYPALPVAGDFICWDWLAGAQTFKVISRRFIWTSPRTATIEYLIGLVDE